MRRLIIGLGLGVTLLLAWQTCRAEDLNFVMHRVGNFRSEACGVGDFNKDGKPDIVAGAYLYLAGVQAAQDQNTEGKRGRAR